MTRIRWTRGITSYRCSCYLLEYGADDGSMAGSSHIIAGAGNGSKGIVATALVCGSRALGATQVTTAKG